MSTTDTPRIWVGCLGCYNAGNLYGYWCDATDAPESTEEWLAECRRQGQNVADPNIYDIHEELWCFDHENFDGFLDGEFAPMTARRVGEMIAEIESEGFPVAAVGAWISHEGHKMHEFEWDAPTRDSFTDAFRGEHEDFRHFCYQQVEELGWGGMEQVPDSLEPYLNWDLIERELDMEYYTADNPDGGVFVFGSN